MAFRGLRAGSFVVLVWLAAASVARAQQSAEGTVVALDNGDLVVDVGTNRGLTDGARIELWRPLKLRHPVTGKVLTDRFRIGELSIAQVGKAMSLARPAGELSREPAAGDIVVWLTSTETASGAKAPAKAGDEGPAKAAPGDLDADASAIAAMFDELRGADLVARIRRYEDYVRARPQGRYARVLYEEAAALRRLVTERDRKGGGAALAPQPSAPKTRSYEGPREVIVGTPVRLAIELDEATGAVLHVRRSGEVAFTSTPMVPVGRGYFAGLVPQERVREPFLEYFIEGTDARGGAFAVVGSNDAPERVQVDEPPRAVPPSRKRATVMILSDYADYNRLRGNDRVWQTEGFFGMRYGDTGVRALRTGFGVYRGVGGTLDELDERGLDGRSVGLTYGYLEGEIGITPAFGLIGRGAVGLLDDGISGGGQLLVRIGRDTETNLTLGGEILGGVGLRSFAQLDLATFPRVPIVLRTEVTNQPAGASPSSEDQAPGIAQGDGELGARGIVQVGYRFVPELTVAVRGSFQGRTIKHAGPGAGLAVGYSW